MPPDGDWLPPGSTLPGNGRWWCSQLPHAASGAPEASGAHWFNQTQEPSRICGREPASPFIAPDPGHKCLLWFCFWDKVSQCRNSRSSSLALLGTGWNYSRETSHPEGYFIQHNVLGFFCVLMSVRTNLNTENCVHTPKYHSAPHECAQSSFQWNKILTLYKREPCRL